MEFWGIEVKCGRSFEVKIPDGKYLHLRQANLGERDEEKPKKSVCVEVMVNGQKLVLGTLHPDGRRQGLFDLVFDNDFQIIHDSENESVYVLGYFRKKGYILY